MASKPSSSIPDGVTATQRAMLNILNGSGRWMDGTELLVHLYDYHRTTQGVTMTAASLVRRGLVEKGLVRRPKGAPDNRKVQAYRITPKGQELLAALRYTEAAK